MTPALGLATIAPQSMLSCQKCKTPVPIYELPAGDHHTSDQSVLCGDCRSCTGAARASHSPDYDVARALQERLERVDAARTEYARLHRQRAEAEVEAARVRRRASLAGLDELGEEAIALRQRELEQALEQLVLGYLARIPDGDFRLRRTERPICGLCWKLQKKRTSRLLFSARIFRWMCRAYEDEVVQPCNFCGQPDALKLVVDFREDQPQSGGGAPRNVTKEAFSSAALSTYGRDVL